MSVLLDRIVSTASCITVCWYTMPIETNLLREGCFKIFSNLPVTVCLTTV